MARDDSGVIEFLEQHIAVSPGHGLGLIYDQCAPPRQALGQDRDCDLKLNLPRRGKKRLLARIKRPLDRSREPNQHWSCDFMADALCSGRRFRTFNVIDEFIRAAQGKDTYFDGVLTADSRLQETYGEVCILLFGLYDGFIAEALNPFAQ